MITITIVANKHWMKNIQDESNTSPLVPKIWIRGLVKSLGTRAELKGLDQEPSSSSLV